MASHRGTHACALLVSTLSLSVAGLAPLARATAEPRAPYRGVDVVRDLQEDQKGATTVAMAARALDHYARTLTLTPSARSAYGFAQYIVQSVDFDAVFSEPFAKVLPDGTRSFALTGAGRPQGYVVEYQRASVDALRPVGFLGFAADLRVREDPDPIPDEERGFGISTNVKVDTGPLSHRTALRGATGILRVLDPANLAALPAPPAAQPASFDARALADFRATMPEGAALLERYASPTPGLSVVGAGEATYTQVRSRLTLDLGKLKADYPDLGKYLETLTSRVEVQAQARFEIPPGLRVAELGYDSPSRSFTLAFKTRGGRIVPYDKEGRPHFEAALQPDLVQAQVGTAVVDATARVLGLTVRLSNVTLATSFRDGPVARVDTRLRALPAPQIEGKALGVVPTWALNAFIPGSMESYGRKVCEGMLRGSRGAGTYASVTVDTRAPGSTQVAAAGGTELVDNFFITFGLRVVQSYVWPSEEVLASAWKLVSTTTSALAKDTERLRAATP